MVALPKYLQFCLDKCVPRQPATLIGHVAGQSRRCSAVIFRQHATWEHTTLWLPYLVSFISEQVLVSESKGVYSLPSPHNCCGVQHEVLRAG
jgi:hypothetical protein